MSGETPPPPAPAPAVVTHTAPARPNALQRLSDAMHRGFADAFGWLTQHVVGSPWITIVAVLVLATIFAQGIWFYSENLSPEKQFTPTESVTADNDEWVKANFKADTQPMRAYFISPSNGNVLTKPALLYMLTYHDWLTTEASGEYAGKRYTFNETCVRPSPADPCNPAEGVLKLWGFRKERIEADADVLATVNNETAWRVVNPTGAPVVSYLNGVQYDAAGNIVSATGTQMWLLNSYTKRKVSGDGDKHPEVDAYELAASTATYGKLNDGAGVGVLTYLYTQGDVQNESGNAISGDVSALAIGYFLLIIFTALVLSRARCKYSHVNLAFITVLSVGLATLSAYGTCWYLGVPFNNVVQVLILVLLGLGVDDAFVIMYSWWDHADEENMKDRMVKALRHAGPAILLTSVTDLVAFAAGSSTRLPALRDFCIYATFGIVFDFAYQTTFFVACAFLSSRRQQEGYADCCCCVPVSDDSGCCVTKGQTKGVHWRESDPGSFRRFFGVYVPRGILSPVGKAAVLVVAAALTSVGIYGCTELKMNFNYDWFIPSSAPIQDVLEVRDTFASNFIPCDFYAGAVDYPNDQAALLEDLALANSSKWVMAGSMSAWLWEFQAWVAAEHPAHSAAATAIAGQDYRLVAPAEFYRLLKLFASTETGPPASAVHIANIAWDETHSTVKASKFPFRLPSAPAEDGMTAYEVVSDFQSLLRGQHVFAHGPFFVFWEGYGIIMDEMIRNVAIAGTCVFFLVLLITANIFLSLAILLNVVLIDVCLLGWMHIIGVYVNSVSVICVVLAVGLVVDYSVHIAGEFVQVSGEDRPGMSQRDQRAAYSISKMGPAVGAGGFSTLLAVLPLCVAESYVFTVFFRMFVLIICFGLYFGVCVLPVVFSFVGPAANLNAVPLATVWELMPLQGFALRPEEPAAAEMQHPKQLSGEMTKQAAPKPTFG